MRAGRAVTYRAHLPPLLTGTTPLHVADLGVAHRDIVDDAAAELAHLAHTTQVSDLAGITWVEALASSRIEGITADLVRAASNVHARGGPSGQTVASNWLAIRALTNRTAPVTVDDVCAAHAVLCAGIDRVAPGRLRRVQNWIGSGGGIEHAIHIPPPPDLVRRHTVDLFNWTADRFGAPDSQAIVDAAVAHGFYETVHPFNDGNGRSGRALLNAHLAAAFGPTAGLVPISVTLAVDPGRYYRALGALRSGDPGPLVALVAAAAADGAVRARRWADDNRNMTAAVDEPLRAVLGAVHDHVAAPTATIAAGASVGTRTVTAALSALTASGLVEPVTVGRRTLWCASDARIDDTVAVSHAVHR
jgi:Fic family protein